MGLDSNSNYDAANASNEKEPIIVLEIEGLPFVFGSNVIYRKLRYDDPGVYYDGTYHYDELVPLNADKQKSLIDRKGSFSTISQKVEQWDGRSSVETFNIRLVDYQKIVTQVCTPGFYLDEILNKKVRIFFGFKNISYPEDYIILFKGYVNNVVIGQGFVNFLFTDPSSKRKQVLFNGTQVTLTNAITSVDTTLVVSSTTALYRTILNAKGENDETVKIGLVLDDLEYVYFTNASIQPDNITLTGVLRGQGGTLAVAHDAEITCQMLMFVEDNPLTIALKTMLSGWNGPWAESLPMFGIVNADNSTTIPNSFTMPLGVDLIRDYGLTAGDFVTIVGSTFPANNAVFTVADVVNDNRTVVVQEVGILTQEDPTLGLIPATVSFRSKYDTYPIQAGLSLTTDDVLVSQFEYIRTTFAQFLFKFYLVGAENSGKEWIETHLFKAIGAYSLTQGSRISVGMTHPPLATDLTKEIGPANVVNPQSVVVERGLDSTRLFYNEIFFSYDYDAINDTFKKTYRVIDADAQDRMQQVSVLEMQIRGLDGSPASESVMAARAARILQRHRFSAETISLDTFFSTGHQIDAGDVLVLTDTDPPVLAVANTETGSRGVVNRIMEVQERSINITAGRTHLKLLSNNGFAFSDRYGVIGPSSLVDGTYANTSSLIKFKDSFGALFPNAEYKKWIQYQGHKVKIHDSNFVQSGETFFNLDSSDPYIMHLSPALGFVPSGDMIIEFADYDDTDANVNALAKSLHPSFDSSATIFSASSSTVFVLDSGFSNRYRAGMICYVQSPDCTRFSPDVKIISVVGDVVTIGGIFNFGNNQNLGFTPQPGDIVQLGGFKDNGNGYRLI